MLSFCQVCLRTDRKLREIAEALCDLHDELCDFGVGSEPKFCYECEYMLKKFNDFKTRCQLAAKIIKVWKKEKAAVRKPLELVAAKLQLSSLSLSNSQNFKLYLYQTSNLRSAPIETLASANVNHIITINIPKEDQIDAFVLKPFDYRIIQNGLIDESEIKTENEDDCDNLEIASNEPNVENLIDTENGCQKGSKACESDTYNDNTNFGEKDDKDFRNFEKDVKDSESDFKDFDNNDTSSVDGDFKPQIDLDLNLSSDDEKPKPKKTPVRKRERKPVTRKKKLTLAELAKVNIHSDSEGEKKPKRKEPSAEVIRTKLAAKFEECGDLIDEMGVTIDKEFILNNLEVMTKYTLRQVRKRVVFPKTITKDGIKILSRLQKRYRNDFPDLFNVEHLTTKEQVEAEFARRKYNERYVISQFKCELCYTGFKFSKLLDYHMQTAHNEHRQFSCSVCKMRFTNDKKLATHTLHHRTVFKCKLCPLITHHKAVMVDHSRSHEGKVYTCDKIKCGATFKCRSGLALHRITAHPTSHPCNACGRNFANVNGLQLHRSIKHPLDTGEAKVIRNLRNIEIEKCDLCDATFTSDHAMKQHLLSIHNKHRNAVVHGLSKTRIRRFLKPPNYVCTVCSKIEHSYGALCWHFKTEHPEAPMYKAQVSHLCHLCGKGFSNITQYTDHEHVHTGARPYQCNQCNKSFQRRINLKSHLERHLPKQRECKHCGKRFRSAANLSSHIKGHIGEKLHVCDICSKSFLHGSTLNAHVRGVHQHIRRIRKPRGTTD